MKGASGFRMLLTWERRLGRSLTQCRERDDRTASNVFDGYGRDSSESRTSRVRFISWLKGRSMSRLRSVGEDSAAVR